MDDALHTLGANRACRDEEADEHQTDITSNHNTETPDVSKSMFWYH
jgi:hypothetical protein